MRGAGLTARVLDAIGAAFGAELDPVDPLVLVPEYFRDEWPAEGSAPQAKSARRLEQENAAGWALLDSYFGSLK